MKKQFSGFLCGVLSMALVGTLGVTALAAGGQAEYGLFGVMLLGSEVVAKGETMVGENGAEVPVVVTFRDEKGGATNYISVRKLAELLDVSIGWNAEKGNVELPQFQPTVISHGVSLADKDKDVPSQPELGITAGPISEIDPVQLQDKTPADTYTTRYQTKFGTAGVQFNPGSTLGGGRAALRYQSWSN